MTNGGPKGGIDEKRVEIVPPSITGRQLGSIGGGTEVAHTLSAIQQLTGKRLAVFGQTGRNNGGRYNDAHDPTNGRKDSGAKTQRYL